MPRRGSCRNIYPSLWHTEGKRRGRVIKQPVRCGYPDLNLKTFQTLNNNSTPGGLFAAVSQKKHNHWRKQPLKQLHRRAVQATVVSPSVGSYMYSQSTATKKHKGLKIVSGNSFDSFFFFLNQAFCKPYIWIWDPAIMQKFRCYSFTVELWLNQRSLEEPLEI